MVEDSEILEISPPIGLKSFSNGKPPKLWCSGEQRLLNCNLLGIISAREVDLDLAPKSAELLQELLTLKEGAFISGWHSPLEKKALQILSRSSAPIIYCVAKSLRRFIPPLDIENRVRQGQALLLTPCSPKAKRISREASLRCNELVAGLSKVLLVLSAPEGSSSLDLAKAALHCGKSVLTLDGRTKKELLARGALPASLEKIQEEFR